MAGVPNITAADVVIQLSVATVFPTPIQIQGFAEDEVYDTPAIEPGQTQMGVDGIFSAGFVFVPIEVMYHLQANSASNDFFDQWWAAEQANLTKYAATGLIVAPSLGKKWSFNTGYLQSYVPLPPGKKILGPRTYGIRWGQMIPSAS